MLMLTVIDVAAIPFKFTMAGEVKSIVFPCPVLRPSPQQNKTPLAFNAQVAHMADT